ncbi:MAG: hypothetical protein II803_06240 [Firmicutes bacterium]|nr:hypothetical protein [Bacillota bacterium]
MKYNTPEVSIVRLYNSDIVTTSEVCPNKLPDLSIGDFDDILRGDFDR